jgi:hypothetical protein
VSATADPAQFWYQAEKGEAHGPVFAFVARIENEQSDVYDRLMSLESLYDKHSPDGNLHERPAAQLLNDMAENVVASNVDTTFASVATAEVRARFLTDGADWSTQRRAKKLEYYSEGLAKQLDVHRKCRLAFKESAKKGAGIVKVYGDRWDEIQIEHIAIEDVIVPDADSRSGAPPLQLHHVQRSYDRERLKAEYPDFIEEIDASGRGALPTYSPRDNTAMAIASANSKIAVIESIRLPIGKRPPKGQEGAKYRTAKGARYIPGRRTITIANATLLDEEYHKPYHPVAMIAWSDRKGSFYPISGVERIAGIQRALNKRNWIIERMLQQNAFLTTFVRPSDFNAAMKTTEIGQVVAIKGDYPETPVLPAVHPELYRSRIDLKQSASDQFGQSQARQRGEIPAGLETGAAVREATAAQTQRFAPQEADFERLVLDVVWLMIDACKELGKAAPTVLESRWQKPIRWSDVDLKQVKIQISAASTLPRSAAGREQTILEWAQAGVISTDTFRRLIEHPDLESEMSMYTSSLDSIDQQIEIILDGGTSTPEPFDNLKMIAWRGNGSYHNARISGAPEAVLEELRSYISLATYLADKAEETANDNAMGAPGAPGEMGAGGPPGGGAPAPALSPQAMQLQAG